LIVKHKLFFVLGVMSGISTEKEIPLEGSWEQQDIKYALIKYFRNNPLKDSYYAAVDIIKQLR
jgi:hypothetical protein